MALTGRTLAWLNLAWRFGHHVVVRMPGRVLRGGDDMKRFLDAVVPEGYVPLDGPARDLLPGAMRCIHCGLCSLACPLTNGDGYSAWDEAWTFVAGPSRSLDRAAVVTASIPPCADCDACAAVCPTGVPITQLAEMLRQLATSPIAERS